MRIDEQEFLIQSIRAGTICYKSLKIVPATIDQNLNSCRIYTKTYNDCLESGIMTEESLEQWMIFNQLLPTDFVATKKTLLNDIDNEKFSLYKNRADKKQVGKIKYLLEELRSKFSSLVAPKLNHNQNTCEFIANLEKQMYLLRATSFYKNRKYKGTNFNKIFSIWQDSLLSESQIRILARSYIWKSIYNQSKSSRFPLFKKHKNKNVDLTVNQRNLLTWSNIYDNVNESLECPDEFVINDDDMLDGWFIDQKRNKDKEKTENLLSSKVHNQKIANSDHLFVVSNDEEEISTMGQYNSVVPSEFFIHNRPGVDV